jgi:molybdate transport system regulatory protein
VKTGSRNNLRGTVTSIQSDAVMSLVKFEVAVPHAMASVLTTESVREMDLKVGDTVTLIVKAIHVLPVKE